MNGKTARRLRRKVSTALAEIRMLTGKEALAETDRFPESNWRTVYRRVKRHHVRGKRK